jgi:hypothetical protein
MRNINPAKNGNPKNTVPIMLLVSDLSDEKIGCDGLIAPQIKNATSQAEAASAAKPRQVSLFFRPCMRLESRSGYGTEVASLRR